MPASEPAGAPEARPDARRPLIFRIAPALAYAVLFIAAFPPVDAWHCALLAPVPLTWLALGPSPTARVLLIVYPVALAMWLWIERWVLQVTLPGYPLLAAYLALYSALYVWMVRRIAARWSRLPMTLVVPISWVGLECLRGAVVFDGYAWYLLGHPLVGWLLFVQSADLLGAYFVSLLVAMIAGALVDVLRWLRSAGSSKTALAAVSTAALVLALNLGYGWWRASAIAGGPPVRVLVIQTNLPQSNKIAWDLESQRRDVADFLEQTRTAFGQAEGSVDLIVWPETMLPVRGLETETLQTLATYGQTDQLVFADSVILLSEELSTPLLVGAPCYLGLRVVDNRWEWDRHHNSAYLVDGMPPYQRYDKVVLTPFGEMMPYVSSWPWLEQRLLSIGAPGMSFTLDASEQIRRLELRTDAGGLTLATPICFEDTVAPLVRRMVRPGADKRVDLLVNLSNDGWFGDRDPGRARHLQIARFRCIENRVPMIRCVNTGLSAAIDSNGNVFAAVGGGRYGKGRTAGWMLAEVESDPRWTVYGRVGDAVGWACLTASALLVIISFRRRADDR